MYSFKEKKKHFNALINPDAAIYDLELLVQKQPHLPIIATYSRNPRRYANDILYLLLDNVTREEIREFRRTRMNSETTGETVKKQPAAEEVKAEVQATKEGLQQPPEAAIERAENAEITTEAAEEVKAEAQATKEELLQQLEETTERAEEAETTAEEAEEAKAEAQATKEELQQQLEEATERAEEAEMTAEEAEEAKAEAEARAEAAEEALEEEKKKGKSKAPVKSKNMKNTRKSTGTTSSTRKSK